MATFVSKHGKKKIFFDDGSIVRFKPSPSPVKGEPPIGLFQTEDKELATKLEEHPECGEEANCSFHKVENVRAGYNKIRRGSLGADVDLGTDKEAVLREVHAEIDSEVEKIFNLTMSCLTSSGRWLKTADKKDVELLKALLDKFNVKYGEE